MDYVELQTTSNFSLLRGASHPEELVQQAGKLGHSALALTDWHTLAGIVRAHAAAEEANLRFITGCRLNLGGLNLISSSSPSKNSPAQELALLVYPCNRDAYARLSRLLTIGKRQAKAQGLGHTSCQLDLQDFLRLHGDLAITLLAPEFQNSYSNTTATADFFSAACALLKDSVSDPQLLSLALIRSYAQRDEYNIEQIAKLSRYLDIPTIATNNVLYHDYSRKALCDVVTCIREHTSLEQAGFLLNSNSERHLKSPAEMQRLLRHFPEALKRTLQVAEFTEGFHLKQLTYEYPENTHPAECTALEHLSKLTWEGAAERYPAGIPAKVSQLLKDELQLIDELNYAKYFLTCHDIVRFARKKGILCQGRGAAANSAVCYCLSITAVDPDRIDLLFARFVSKERSEPPDIDIDFENDRREEVIQYIYNKYGRDHAALTGTIISYKARSAIRDVGKVFGLSLEVVDQLARALHRWTGTLLSFEELRAMGLDPEQAAIWNTLLFCRQLQGFPRHLSQHVGGFIIAQDPLCEIVPIAEAAMDQRSMIEWDKDDIEVMGMLKIDVLALGMLTCIKKALVMINKSERSGLAPLEFHQIPAEDPAVYEMLCRADTIGVFQIESRAQMSMLPRLKPRCFYDLVIQVAIVRPGPIHGDMVHPFLRRRSGLEKIEYPDEEVKAILGKTLGVPIFQEQAMRLAIALAGFSPGEAEQLRRAMAAWKKNKNKIEAFKDRILEGMQKRGYTSAFAENCVNQLKGFSEYGFPESHAASFALLVYASAWIKYYYPAIFAAALINSQPMGFYAPAQIIGAAQKQGVKILPIDFNQSQWECTTGTTANGKSTLQLGFCMIKGLSELQAELLARHVADRGPFSSIADFWRSLPANYPFQKNTLHKLARADAFGSLKLSRRQALWEIQALPLKQTPLDPGLQFKTRQQKFRPLSLQTEIFSDYSNTGISLKAHPMSLLRTELNAEAVLTAAQFKEISPALPKKSLSVAGLVLFKQRPQTSNGVIFITLEDETDIFNVIIWPAIFNSFKQQILSSTCLKITGKRDGVDGVSYLIADHLECLEKRFRNDLSRQVKMRSYSY